MSMQEDPDGVDIGQFATGGDNGQACFSYRISDRRDDSGAEDRGGSRTEGPFGATGVPLPLQQAEALPLGPLPNARIPDVHFEVLDPRFKAKWAKPLWSGSLPASAGRRVRPTSPRAAISSSATYPTTG